MKIEDKHLDQRLSTNLKTFTKGENPLNVLSKSDNNNIREDLWCISIKFKVNTNCSSFFIGFTTTFKEVMILPSIYSDESKWEIDQKQSE